MKNITCITIFLSLLIVTTTTTVLAQDQPVSQTIDVIGTGRIRGENIAGARDQAISDSLVTSISLVTANQLQQQVFIQSFQEINRLLFSEADQFVQDYKVLTEDTTGKVYRVMVQATVSVEKIRELLIQNEILSQNAGPLKVLLLVAEKDLDDLFYRYWWGNARFETVSEAPLAGALVKQGFVVVNHRPSWSGTHDFDTLMERPLYPGISDSPLEGRTAAPDQNPPWSISDDSDTFTETLPTLEIGDAENKAPFEQGTATLDHELPWTASDNSGTLMATAIGPEMTDDQAIILGARYQADVVIVGTATVKKASNVLENELRSFEGALAVRAIRTDTGALLSEINHKFITADADNIVGSHRALMEAGAQTGELLSWKIQTAWQQTSQKGPTAATIVVEGSFQLPHLVAFRRVLTGMQGITDLQTTEMTPRETILSLYYEGTTKELAEALLLNAFEGFGVHIAEATPGTIRLSLVSNQSAVVPNN